MCSRSLPLYLLCVHKIQRSQLTRLLDSFTDRVSWLLCQMLEILAYISYRSSVNLKKQILVQ